MTTQEKTKIGSEPGRCDYCGENAKYQEYTVKLLREYEEDGTGQVLDQVPQPFSLHQYCERCFEEYY